MNPIVGWSLAAIAIVLGYLQYGGYGVLLALSVIVFWLLLQFSRATRALRAAASRPIGSVASAVTLHTKLKKGMLLTDILVRTGSLGVKVDATEAADSERFAWSDAGGAKVTARLVKGRLVDWQLERTEDSAA